MEEKPVFSCRDTEVVLQILGLQQHIDEGHGREAVNHVIRCLDCTAKGYSGISNHAIECKGALSIWAQNRNMLTRPQTLEQCLAFEHIWMRRCDAWMCTQVREHLHDMRLQFETTMDELGKLLTVGADCALDTTRGFAKEAHALVTKAHEKITAVLKEIHKNTTE